MITNCDCEMSSFEKINYNLRPNKCVERKMMFEAVSRLSIFDHLVNYRYIGLGSPYFADFILIHKNLGIKDLVSIEKEEAKKERFDFNIPYSGVKMQYGKSTTILPNLELHTKKNILWLDYDDKLSDYMFSDINTFFFNSIPGSFFIISLNVEEDYIILNPEENLSKSSLKEHRLNELIKRVGKNRIPLEYLTLNLNTKNMIISAYDMINRQIKRSLTDRNGVDKDQIEYSQVLNFTYKDNATIMTIGGLIFDKSQKSTVTKMAFDNFDFFRPGEENYKIQCPNLTVREIKALDKALPDLMEIEEGHFVNKKLQKIPLIPSDIKNYAKIYRYYPNFSEINQ